MRRHHGPSPGAGELRRDGARGGLRGDSGLPHRGEGGGAPLVSPHSPCSSPWRTCSFQKVSLSVLNQAAWAGGVEQGDREQPPTSRTRSGGRSGIHDAGFHRLGQDRPAVLRGPGRGQRPGLKPSPLEPTRANHRANPSRHGDPRSRAPLPCAGSSAKGAHLCAYRSRRTSEPQFPQLEHTDKPAFPTGLHTPSLRPADPRPPRGPAPASARGAAARGCAHHRAHRGLGFQNGTQSPGLSRALGRGHCRGIRWLQLTRMRKLRPGARARSAEWPGRLHGDPGSHKPRLQAPTPHGGPPPRPPVF